MRRTAPAALALLLALLPVACAAPTGAPVEEGCDASWRFVESHILAEVEGERQTVPIECIRRAGLRRIRIGFMLPPGPSCFALSEIRVVESGDAVSISLVIARDDDPLAGACPAEPMRAATEIELQAPVADRALLDGSRSATGPAATMAP